MTTEVQADATKEIVEETQTPEGETTETKTPTAEERLAAVEAELVKKEELLNKVRKFEKENKEAAAKALAEQGKFKELYDAELNKRTELEGKIKAGVVDSAIQEALKDSNAKSISTVMKLIDRNKIVFDGDAVDTKSIQSLIKELKTSDPVLFGDEAKPAPAVKKAGEGDVIGGFEKEIKAATTQKQIESVMRKYGKL